MLILNLLFLFFLRNSTEILSESKESLSGDMPKRYEKSI